MRVLPLLAVLAALSAQGAQTKWIYRNPSTGGGTLVDDSDENHVLKNVRLTEGGCCWLNGVVSISKAREGDGIDAITAAFTGHRSMKNVISCPERGPLALRDSQLTTPCIPPFAVMMRTMPPMIKVKTMMVTWSASKSEPTT